MRLSVVPIWIMSEEKTYQPLQFGPARRFSDDFGMLRDFLPLHMLSVHSHAFVTFHNIFEGECRYAENQ